ncbi:unnamed protein product [Durusdinium trenchii]|uniref:Pentatricopeptide repeat-containing protein, chloroplastic n=2 Tax=Durusdinium trenchii TaxID=1381693 RepID=A0ABP0HJN4_9DINO
MAIVELHPVPKTIITETTAAPPTSRIRPFFAALYKCKREGAWFKALDLLQEARVRGLQFEVPLPSCLALASCASSKVGGSGPIGTPLPRIRGQSKGGHWRWSVNILRSMHQACLEANLFAWSACVSACEKAQLREWAAWPVGLEFLLRAELEGCSLDQVALSAAMACCEKARGQWCRALDLFQDMPNSFVEANVVSLGAAVSSCEKGLSWGPAFELLGSAKRRGLQPNTIVVNAASSVCEKFQTWEVALELLGPDSSAVSFGATVGSFEAGFWFWSIQLLTQMAQQTLQPLVSTWNSALASSAAKWQCASELLGQLPAPDALSLASAITALAGGVKSPVSSEVPLMILGRIHKKLRKFPGDHSGCDAEVIQAAGRVGHWHLALQSFLDAGEAAKHLPMSRIAGIQRASLLWSQAAWSCEASWQPGAWPLPEALAKSEVLLPL